MSRLLSLPRPEYISNALGTRDEQSSERHREGIRLDVGASAFPASSEPRKPSESSPSAAAMNAARRDSGVPREKRYREAIGNDAARRGSIILPVRQVADIAVK